MKTFGQFCEEMIPAEAGPTEVEWRVTHGLGGLADHETFVTATDAGTAASKASVPAGHHVKKVEPAASDRAGLITKPLRDIE